MAVDQICDVGSSEEPGGSAVTFEPGSPSVEKSSIMDTMDGKQKDEDEEKSGEQASCSFRNYFYENL